MFILLTHCSIIFPLVANKVYLDSADRILDHNDYPLFSYATLFWSTHLRETITIHDLQNRRFAARILPKCLTSFVVSSDFKVWVENILQYFGLSNKTMDVVTQARRLRLYTQLLYIALYP